MPLGRRRNRIDRSLRERGVPPESIAVAGDSCGGGLALSVLLILKQRGAPLPGTEPANFGNNDLRLAYFGTTLLRPLEGDAWTKWWSPLRAKLLKAQGHRDDGALQQVVSRLAARRGTPVVGLRLYEVEVDARADPPIVARRRQSEWAARP